MDTQDIQIVTIAEMRQLVGASFDHAARADLFAGKTTLRNSSGTFQVDPKEAAQERLPGADEQIGAKDVGDKVCELMAAADEGREPAEWATSPAKSDEHDTDGDIGDRVAALFAKERGEK